VSPIKPSLAPIHTRAPLPHAVRQVHCPHCGTQFEASAKAVSLRCPACTQPMKFEDLTLRRKLDGELSTMGHVNLSPPSEMSGKLTCGELTNEGRFTGVARVYGPAVLAEESHTVGQIEARTLQVLPGATLRGKVSISPKCSAPSKHHSLPLPERPKPKAQTADVSPSEMAPPRLLRRTPPVVRMTRRAY